MNDQRDNRSPNFQQHQRPRVEWQLVKTVENERFLIQVNKLPLHFPRFSISISAKNRDGAPTRFIPAIGRANNGIFTLRPFLADLRELIDEVEGFIQRELQRAEDDRILESERRAVQDRQQGESKLPGLKEWAKRDRRKARRDREEERDGQEG